MNEIINPEALKEAMRAWVTGVAIVTGSHAGHIHGMTANSFNSIALDPPTVMVALQHQTRTEHLVRESGSFGVSILEIAQIGLAKRFAGQAETDKPRFEDVETFTLTSASPLIRGGIAYLDCKVVQAIEVGSTTAFLGEVIASRVDRQADHTPLLYFNRQWRKMHTP